MSNSLVFVVQINDVFAERRRIASCRAPAVAPLYGSAQINNDAQINDVFAENDEDRVLQSSSTALFYGSAQTYNNAQINDVFAEKRRISSCRAPAVALLYGPAQIEMRRSTTFSRRRGGSHPAELLQWFCFMALRISTTMRRSTTSSRRGGGSPPAELQHSSAVWFCAERQ